VTKKTNKGKSDLTEEEFINWIIFYLGELRRAIYFIL